MGPDLTQGPRLLQENNATKPITPVLVLAFCFSVHRTNNLNYWEVNQAWACLLPIITAQESIYSLYPMVTCPCSQTFAVIEGSNICGAVDDI